MKRAEPNPRGALFQAEMQGPQKKGRKSPPSHSSWLVLGRLLVGLRAKERAQPFGILLKALLHEDGHFAGLASGQFELNAAMARIDGEGIGERFGVLGILPPRHGRVRLGLHQFIPFSGQNLEGLDAASAR